MIDSIYVAAMTLAELEQLFLCEIEGDDDFYDVLAYNIARNNQDSLLINIDKFDDKRRRAVIFALGAIKSSKSDSIFFIRSEVSNTNSKISAEAISSLISLQELKHWGEIKKFLSATDPILRSAALKYSRHSLGEKSFELLVSALSDDDPTVRETAVDELAELGSFKAVALITPLLNDGNENVVQAATTAIDQLKGEE